MRARGYKEKKRQRDQKRTGKSRVQCARRKGQSGAARQATEKPRPAEKMRGSRQPGSKESKTKQVSKRVGVVLKGTTHADGRA